MSVPHDESSNTFQCLTLSPIPLNNSYYNSANSVKALEEELQLLEVILAPILCHYYKRMHSSIQAKNHWQLNMSD